MSYIAKKFYERLFRGGRDDAGDDHDRAYLLALRMRSPYFQKNHGLRSKTSAVTLALWEKAELTRDTR